MGTGAGIIASEYPLLLPDLGSIILSSRGIGFDGKSSEFSLSICERL